MNVYIPSSGFATQGPCDSGFHVPLITEWQGLKTIMDGLSLTSGDNWRINLHMPFSGYRNFSSTSHDGQGSYCYYWSSSPSFEGNYRSRSLRLNSSSVSADSYSARAYGFSLRCFKDSFELPESSWTVIQGTLGNAGIFWNQTEGLISITDGTTGYTIQDKNCGATTVYNDGDTLTQANMGNMYQWGNNYGFPSTGTISKTSSTQVNANNYGPGNYYSSDTFITGSNDWSSVYNDNLRGGTDGNVPVTTMKEVQNIYIGEYVPLITTPGIFHNATDGLISFSSNGTTWYTLSDKNLGATTVFNYGDTLSQNNCGKFYQRGNNYGFPRTGSVTTSSTKVNASSYGPDNYYSNSTFRTSSSDDADWSSSKNDNLWGNTTNTSIARRGPCDEGFHVPKSNEMYTVLNGLYTMTGSPSTNVFYEYIQRYLLIPLAGFRAYNGSASDSTRSARLRTSSVYNTYAYGAFINQSSNQPNKFVGRINGYSIRPFKNEAVQPTEDWTVLYQPS